jgi:hypothetical protein
LEVASFTNSKEQMIRRNEDRESEKHSLKFSGKFSLLKLFYAASNMGVKVLLYFIYNAW